jgi:hypothetical protein
VRVLIKVIKLCKKKKEKRNYVKQDAEMEKEKQQRIFTGRAYHRYCYYGYTW